MIPANLKKLNNSMLHKPPLSPKDLSYDHKLFFIHIPRTGGTYSHAILCNLFEPDKIFPGRFDNDLLSEKNDLERYSFFSGHFSYESVVNCVNNFSFITILRSPLERLISHYNFYRYSHDDEKVVQYNNLNLYLAKTQDIFEFVINPLNKDLMDLQVRMLAGVRGREVTESDLTFAKEVLSSSLFYGFTESLDDDLNFFTKTLFNYEYRGAKLNEGKGKIISLDDSLAYEIKTANKYDYELYEFAKSKNVSLLARILNIYRLKSKLKLGMFLHQHS